MTAQGDGDIPSWLDRDPIAYHAAVRPKQLACIELKSDRRLTYTDLDAHVGRAAGWLTARIGAAQGQRVAFLGRNTVEQLAILFACHRIGAIFQPLNWRLSGPELKVLIEDAEPALVIFDEEFAPAALEAMAGNASAQPFTLDADGGNLRREIEAAAPAPAAPAEPNEPFILLYTSGTTGRPKGAIVTRLNAFFAAFNFRSVGQVESGSVMLCDAPMFHTVGLMAVTCTAMQVGATVAISDRFLPGPTLARLSDPDLGVTHYFAVPQIAQMLRDHPDYPTSDLTRLTALFTGGAPMPPSLIGQFLDDGVTLANGYGMTEAGTVLCMPFDHEIIRARIDWSGLAAPATQLRIVRQDGTDAEPGEPGEIWLKGPGVMPGYWNRPDENARCFVDGWFRSGDAGLRDDQGYYRLIDRWKDMYITGGENVYPAEVEAVLAALPGVTEVAVVGVADERWGECGWAFVVGDADLTSADIIACCDGKLARYKLPKEVRFVEALPRTASGKVQKDVLRKMAAPA